MTQKEKDLVTRSNELVSDTPIGYITSLIR